MMSENKILLPHHEQQNLCTTRLPYRQGRKLTAVKTYTVTTESNHLLIFGVPSLNLRQETKSLFIKFGKLIQFTLSPNHSSEAFTETYHAQFERIQSARIAKKMLDTKNFYGGSIHVCYAPEFETISETRQKLIQRHKDVINRLRNLAIEKEENKVHTPEDEEGDVARNTNKDKLLTDKDNRKLNMGEINTINTDNKKIVSMKRKHQKDNIEHSCNESTKIIKSKAKEAITDTKIANTISETEIVDCTSVGKEVITNINESLNYNKFGNEVIRKIPPKPLNKITFNINKNI